MRWPEPRWTRCFSAFPGTQAAPAAGRYEGKPANDTLTPMFSSSNLGTGPRGGNRHCGTYQQVGVVSQVHGDASPHQMVAMLFDGIFESLAHARAAMAAGEIETKGLAIGRVLRIVDEGLRGALDLQQGGTLARDLHDLYGYITARLSVANLKNDPAALDECAALLSPLREAWTGIRADVEPARAA